MKSLSLHEELTIKRLYKRYTYKHIACELGKSPKAVAETARKRGYKKIPNWSNEEIEFLKLNGAKAASIKYDRSLNSCKIKHSRLCKSHKN